MNTTELIQDAKRYTPDVVMDFPEEAAALIAKFAELLAKRNAPNIEDERKAFEAHFQANSELNLSHNGEDYVYTAASYAWVGWQARATLPAEQDAELRNALNAMLTYFGMDED